MMQVMVNNAEWKKGQTSDKGNKENGVNFIGLADKNRVPAHVQG